MLSNKWVTIGIVSILLIVMPVLLAPDFFFKNFTCRYVCTGYNTGLMLTSVIGDIGTTIAYLGIPIAIYRSLQLINGIRMKGGAIAVMFMLFIFSCGMTHFLQAVAWFKAYYNLMAYVADITAIVSLYSLWNSAFYVIKTFTEQKKEAERLQGENDFIKNILKEHKIEFPAYEN